MSSLEYSKKMGYSKEMEEAALTEPTASRQVELHQAYEANRKRGEPPYAGVVIATLSELLWLLKERDWAHGFGIRERRKKEANFHGASLVGIKRMSISMTCTPCNCCRNSPER